MSTKLHAQVFELMKAVGQQCLETPQVPAEDIVRLRARLVMEEAFEFLQSLLDTTDSSYAEELKDRVMELLNESEMTVDLVEAADALADLDYVVEGSRIAFGIDGEPIADEVHRTNMLKVGGPKDEFGKTLKPAGWKPPDIEKLLKEQGWEG